MKIQQIIHDSPHNSHCPTDTGQYPSKLPRTSTVGPGDLPHIPIYRPAQTGCEAVVTEAYSGYPSSACLVKWHRS